ncbi:hypothetical protein [Nannocystis punicea]|uniref:Uncharacterized protein n=1 Tax=Nannocystis punicea TaxID=2995304 RepID=A0ABY7H785_9BACT|nr:hypothetical protein [Nannocystis poenicansa]WAS95127.1 hypothetical protein O0S08_03110 [Nannocystis poenicansa]
MFNFHRNNKGSAGGRPAAPRLPDLEQSVAPLAADEGPLQVRKDGVLHVRTSLRAGDLGGEGTGGTDRSNTP